jgi:hypothetical protein
LFPLTAGPGYLGRSEYLFGARALNEARNGAEEGIEHVQRMCRRRSSAGEFRHVRQAFVGIAASFSRKKSGILKNYVAKLASRAVAKCSKLFHLAVRECCATARLCVSRELFFRKPGPAVVSRLCCVMWGESFAARPSPRIANKSAVPTHPPDGAAPDEFPSSCGFMTTIGAPPLRDLSVRSSVNFPGISLHDTSAFPAGNAPTDSASHDDRARDRSAREVFSQIPTAIFVTPDAIIAVYAAAASPIAWDGDRERNVQGMDSLSFAAASPPAAGTSALGRAPENYRNSRMQGITQHNVSTAHSQLLHRHGSALAASRIFGGLPRRRLAYLAAAIACFLAAGLVMFAALVSLRT